MQYSPPGGCTLTLSRTVASCAQRWEMHRCAAGPSHMLLLWSHVTAGPRLPVALRCSQVC